MTKPRTPPVWLVLLPALALAAVGVRAVTAEMRASEDAARERARSVASRLARSVDALIEEYAGPLPKPGTQLSDADAESAVAHLAPHGYFSVRSPMKSSPAPTSGLTAFTLTPGRSGLWNNGMAKDDAELAQDALDAARRLAESPHGAAAAAALLGATAAATVRTPWRWPLRHAEARYDLDLGDARSAFAALRATWLEQPDGPPGFLWDHNGVPYPETSLALAAEIATPSDPVDWIAAAYDHCARNPWIADGALLDQVERRLGPRLPRESIALRRVGLIARTAALDSTSRDATSVVIETNGADVGISIWRLVYDSLGRARELGGEIPPTVVSERLAGEARALASEAGVAMVRLTSAAGGHAFDTAGSAPIAKDFVVESVPLADPTLSAWRAEAVVAPESGVPASAWLLAAALAVTTAALVAGMLALRRAAERSARLAEDRQTFLDHVAHELRTPAAAVQALTEELASGHVTKEREPQYREHLLRESRRLSALVEDTLDLTRLDAGRLAFKMEPADLRDVVRRAIEESRVAGRVVATLPDAAVVRAIDEATLRRAVKNLVENAVRHGGGEAPVTVKLEASAGHASIVVADKGRGIAAEHLPRLFERFYRVPSATHEVKGVGLGLALCREVARAHGGDVSVESRVGTGSTFTLSIPLV